MGKRHPDFPAWQWRSNPQSRQNAKNQALDLIAIAMMVLAFLLVVSGVFSENATSAVIGLIALFAGLGLQRQGRKPEAKQPGSQAF